jgi:carbon-monoxide dehydrogenase medium subunit
MELGSDSTCRSIGIGVTGRAAVPEQAISVEHLLTGKKITSELIEESGRLIQEGAEPIEDMRGSAAYKTKALGAILRRALNEAVRRSEALRVR